MLNWLPKQVIEGQQEPAAELLIYLMVPVAYGGLRHLGNERLRIAQQQLMQLAVAIELFPRR